MAAKTEADNIEMSWRLTPLARPLATDLGLAVGFAVLWWLVAMGLQSTQAVHVLTDQTGIFMPAARSVANPYLVEGFFNPPWAALLLLPFGLLSLPLAALAQLVVYFVLLTLVIHKFGGDRRAVLIALTSFVALNSATELNAEWMVLIGLLVPERYSLPFLLIKPQTALGYFFSFSWREMVRAVLVALLFGVVALLLWGHVLPTMIEQAGDAAAMSRPFNAAPMTLIGAPLSILLGVGIGFFALRRHDPILCILAWVFFMPYLALYGLLPHLALLGVRWYRVGLFVSLVLWVLFGGLLASHLVNVLLPR